MSRMLYVITFSTNLFDHLLYYEEKHRKVIMVILIYTVNIDYILMTY